MKILLVNDDGIAAPGIRALAKVLAPQHEVSVVAPAKEQSGMSQALSVGVPLIVHEEDLGIDGVWARSVEGTPADCTKLALEILLKEKPDLVISGINNGATSARTCSTPARSAQRWRDTTTAFPRWLYRFPIRAKYRRRKSPLPSPPI